MSRNPAIANSPIPRQVVNLWSLVGHPTKAREWKLKRKLGAAKDAGFDGFTTQLAARNAKLRDKLGAN